MTIMVTEMCVNPTPPPLSVRSNYSGGGGVRQYAVRRGAIRSTKCTQTLTCTLNSVFCTIHAMSNTHISSHARVFCAHSCINKYNWEKGKVLRKHIMHEKIAASVLLKLFMSGNERCHVTKATSALAQLYF